MPGPSYLVFGDIEGKLEVLRVECIKCFRKGRYSVRTLIEKYGRKARVAQVILAELAGIVACRHTGHAAAATGN
jgi:hypothetical protein